jgi:hypothetical protein
MNMSNIKIGEDPEVHGGPNEHDYPRMAQNL